MYPQKTDPKKTARAGMRNVQISTKNSVEIGNFIKGMKVQKARNYLKEVLKMKKAIPYKKYITHQAHRKGIGPGRYPINATKKVLDLLNTVEKNAEYKGFDTNSLFIKYFSANIGRRFHRPRKNRLSGQVTKSTNISVVVEEKI